MGDIHYLMSQAMTDRGHSFEICWAGANHEYVLSVEASARGGDASWKMFGSLSRESQPLWTYISCDVLLVHNLVKSTAGEGDKDAPVEYPGASGHKIESLVRRDVIASDASKKSKSFAGDLSLVQMPTLIQSILMAKMTGVLEVEDPVGKGRSQVFFVDGAAVHCVATDSYGEEGILELLTWKEGSFHFDPNKTNEVRTVKQSVDSLLLKGMTIIDNAAFLSNLGVTPESRLVRSHGDLSDAELEERTKKGAPVNMQRQKALYRAVDPQTSLGEILDKLKWPRSQWVPVLANLMRTDLVALAAANPKEHLVLMEPKRVDKQLIENVMMSLRSQETGLFNYASFLYFLEQEYFRAYRSATPLSVVVFQMRIKGQQPAAPREPLPVSWLCAAVRRISSAKRHVDLLAHYENYDYAALLPNTTGSGARVFAARVLKALMAEPLVPNSNTECTFSAAFGIASIPEDFTELSQLLAAAEIAKTTAASGPEPIVLFSEIKHQYAFPSSQT